MFRAIFTCGRTAVFLSRIIQNGRRPAVSCSQSIQNRNFSVISAPQISGSLDSHPKISVNLLSNPQIFQIYNNTQVRTVTKFSLKKGKRKTVKAALKRFYRLDWGGWIRTRAGRHKHLWRKSTALKKRLREHVFVNATQATLLDKMVTKYWKRPKYYVDDPYEPYHSREEWTFTRRKPLP